MTADDFDAIAERLMVEQRAAHAERVWRETVPARFRTAHLSQLGPEAAPIVEWAENPEGRNLVIAGPVGTGKTHAAIAAVRPAVEACMNVVVWPVVELFDRLRPSAEFPADIVQCCQCDVLVLDDLGAERPTEWTLERLYLIVNHRWMHALPIVVTTNAASSEQLGEQVGERMRSRLVGSGALTVRLAGHDRRRLPPERPA